MLENEYFEKLKEKIEEKNLKYQIVTFGCQLNENDSEKMAGMLEELGYQKTEDWKEADIIVFNTCCVRENAEERLFGKIGEVKSLKTQKDLIIAIRWMYDAGRTNGRKNQKKLSICGYCFWNSHTAKSARTYLQNNGKQ